MATMGSVEKLRADGRNPDELRKISFIPDVNPYAEGSVQVSFGRTTLLVTVSIEREVPEWLKERNEGWITAEYGMLPRSTHSRNRREASAGKQSGRTLEIQRLIGRALRAAIDLKKIGPITLRVDCDVLCADGGTRTAAINGGWIALERAVHWARTNGVITNDLPLVQVAAISVGRVRGTNFLDLCYEEDSGAEFDLNVVMTSDMKIIEIQGTAERAPITSADLTTLTELAADGIRKIFGHQNDALKS